MHNRRDILAQLEIILGEVTGVNTVVRTISEIDITQYTESQLPLVNIIEPSEDIEEQSTSMRAMMNLEIIATVYFVCWGISITSSIENLIKNIRNKIGNNFTLNGTCTGTWVIGVSKPTGEMPLFRFNIEFSCEYYINLKST